MKLMIAEQGGDAVFLSIRHGAPDGGFAGKQLDVDDVGQAAFNQRVEQFEIITVRTRERAAFAMPSERKQQRLVGQRVADGLRVAQYFADTARAFQKIGAELDDIEGQVFDLVKYGGKFGGIAGDKRHGDFGASASDNGIFDNKAGTHKTGTHRKNSRHYNKAGSLSDGIRPHSGTNRRVLPRIGKQGNMR